MIDFKIPVPSFAAPILSFFDLFGTAPGVLMSFGDFEFGINTAAYKKLKRATQWRWPSVQVVSRAPILQFVGKGEETITLSGMVLTEWKGGFKQLDILRAIASAGKPQPLIDGRGQFYGYYALTKLEEEQEEHRGDGLPRVQNFTITLKYYDETD